MYLEEAPGNVFVKKSISGLTKDSVLLVSQLSVIDRERLIEKIDRLNPIILREVEQGIKLILNIDQESI
jgi:mRNA interferase MazF